MASQDHISQDHIRNPVEWGWDQLTLAAVTVGSLGRSLGGSEESRDASLPAVRSIKATDLRDALVRGLDDLGVYRTDVIFLRLIYPLAGIALAWVTFGYETLPLLFPLASGFTLVGPVAAVGLYENEPAARAGRSHHVDGCLRRYRLASLRCDPGAGIGATGDLPALARRGQRDLRPHPWP